MANFPGCYFILYIKLNSLSVVNIINLKKNKKIKSNLTSKLLSTEKINSI